MKKIARNIWRICPSVDFSKYRLRIKLVSMSVPNPTLDNSNAINRSIFISAS